MPAVESLIGGVHADIQTRHEVPHVIDETRFGRDLLDWRVSADFGWSHPFRSFELREVPNPIRALKTDSSCGNFIP